MSRKHQKNQMELVFDTGDSGEATRPVSGENELGMAESKSGSPVNTGNMMEEIITRENLKRALKRVKCRFCRRCLIQHSVLEKLNSWVRRRLRSYQWKLWERGRARYAELRKLGFGKDLAAQTAGSSHSIWKIIHSPALAIGMNNAFFEKLGLFRPGIR